MKRLLILVPLLLLLSLGACAAGPHQLQRSVDDWDQKLYVENPLLDGVLWVIPVFPLLNLGAAVGDFVIVDAWYFWSQDVWDGKGTAFKHFDVAPTDGTMESLLINGSKFLEKK